MTGEMRQGLLGSLARLESRWHPALATIVLLAAFLRLYDLSAYPKWYSDEANHLITAQTLRGGGPPLACGAYYHTGLTPFFPYSVLFHAKAALLLRWVHPEILAVRLLAAIAAILTVLVVYRIAREFAGLAAALIAASAAAFHPPSVLWDRWGYPQAWAMLFVGLAFLALLKYRKHPAIRWAVAAGVCVGVAMAYSYWVFPMVLFILIAILATRGWAGWRHALLSAAAVATPLLLITLPFALMYGTGTLWADAMGIFGVNREFVGGAENTVAGHLGILLQNYLLLARSDWMLLAGMAGLLCATQKWQRLWLIGAFLALSLYVVRVRGDHMMNFFYNAYPFKAFLFVGVGLLAAWTVRIVGSALRPRDYALKFACACFGLALVVGGFGRAACASGRMVISRASTAVDPLCVQDQQDAVELARWVNERLTRQDSSFVLASSGIQWLIHAKSADLLAVSSREGRRAFIFSPMPKERYAFDCTLANAKYFISDSLFRNWTMQQGCAWLVTRMEREKWPMVFELGEYRVFANPKRLTDKVLEEAPLILADPGTYRRNAEAAMNAADYATAVEEYRKLVRMVPRDADVLSNVGVAYARLGNLPLAQAYLRRAVGIDPRHEAARRSLKAVEDELAGPETTVPSPLTPKPLGPLLPTPGMEDQRP